MVSTDSMSSYLGLFQDSGFQGTSLAVQWLRLHASTAGAEVQSLVGELSSYMPRCSQRKKKIPQVFRGKSTHTVEPLGVFLYYDHKDLSCLRNKISILEGVWSCMRKETGISKNFWENTQLAEPVELYCHLCVTLSGWKTYDYATEIQNMGEINVVSGYPGKVFVEMGPKLGPCDYIEFGWVQDKPPQVGSWIRHKPSQKSKIFLLSLNMHVSLQGILCVCLSLI